jgi:hypothetical protein
MAARWSASTITEARSTASALAQRGHRVSGTVALLGESGWPPERTIDAGDITGARATESYLVIWLRIMARTGGQSFNIAVQRAA